MINWTDIDNEVEIFQNGYREGFIAIFKKYEGQDTDHVTTQNKVVKVTVTSFANRYGIPETTFRRWISEESADAATSSKKPANWTERMAEATAKAKAEAEAAAEAARIAEQQRHQEELASALERQKREAQLAEAKRLEAEKAKIRAEEQAKAKAAAEKEIAELKAKMAEAAKAAEFDLSTLTEAQKAEVMTILANDPDSASDFFEAQAKERERKNREAAEKARQQAEQRAENKARQEEQERARRRSKDYADSALNLLANKVMPSLFEFRNLSQVKPISLTDINNGEFESLDPIYNMAYALEAVAASIREQLDLLNVERELSSTEQ